MGKKLGRTPKKRVSEDVSHVNNNELTWECTACTYRNRFETFRCEICHTRKGTSTRKPRQDEALEMQKTVHEQVVRQVEKEKTSNIRKRERSTVLAASAVMSGTSSSLIVPSNHDSPSTSRHSPDAESLSGGSIARSSESKRSSRPFCLPDSLIFRTSPKKITVVVNGVVATITEFRRKPHAVDRLGLPATVK